MELRFIREVLEGTFAPDLADELLADALDGHPPLRDASDVLTFCRGPLAQVLERRAGAGVRHMVLESLEPVLGASAKRATAPPPSITETAPGSVGAASAAMAIDIDLDGDGLISLELDASSDDDDAATSKKTTVQIPMVSEGGRVGVLIVAKSPRLGDTLVRALGDDRVLPKTTNDSVELRRAIFSVMPNLLVIDAAYEPSDVPRSEIATVMTALPVSIQPVVWGADTDYGKGLVQAMRTLGAEAAYLDRTTGIATLLDLVRARLAG